MAIGSRPTCRLTPKAVFPSSGNPEPSKRNSIYTCSWQKRQFLGGALSINTRTKTSRTPLRNSVKCSVSQATDTTTGTVDCSSDDPFLASLFFSSSSNHQLCIRYVCRLLLFDARLNMLVQFDFETLFSFCGEDKLELV